MFSLRIDKQWKYGVDKKGVFPLSQPLIFPVEIEVRILCAATMGA